MEEELGKTCQNTAIKVFHVQLALNQEIWTQDVPITKLPAISIFQH